MKNRIVLFLVAWLVALRVLAIPANYFFTHVNNENGLSQNNVKAIVQDSYGFIWFGTKNGLNRYDGEHVVHFTVEDVRLRCGDQNISALNEDHKKCLWIGTDNGVYRYDPIMEEFTFINDKATNGKEMRGWVNHITNDDEGNVWIVIPDDGIFRYTPEGILYGYQTTFSSMRERDDLQYLCVCSDGEIWACSCKNGLFRYDKKSDSFEQITVDNQGRTLLGIEFNTLSQKGDELILSVHHGGLMAYNYKRNELRDITLQDFHHTFVRNAKVYGEDIWVGTYDGLFILNEQQHSISHIRQDMNPQLGLPDNIVYVTYRDREGGYWIGTMFGGACYLPDRELDFTIHTTQSQTGTLRIRELAEDANGTLWIGSENGGINRMDLCDGIIVPHHGEIHREKNHNIILSVHNDRGTIYCNYYNHGIEIITPKDENHYSSKVIKLDENIYAHMTAKDGSHYIGTDRGIYRMSQEVRDFEFLPYTEGYWIFDIMQDCEDNIWAASMGRGVLKINKNGTVKRYYHEIGNEHSLSSNSVSSIMQDSKGQIWFSTDRGGICRINPQSETFTRFSTQEGLPDNVAYKILEDSIGNLWFGTNRGLVRLDPETESIRVFTVKDGLSNNQFNYKSAVKGSDGRFYFGTIDGLVSFVPESCKQRPLNGEVYITKLTISGHEMKVNAPDSPLTSSIQETATITLPHNRTNIAMDIAFPKHFTLQTGTLQYKLEPIDKEWIGTNRNCITYANLLPGKYVLKLRVTDGGKISPVKELHILVTRPWWKKKWAQASYLTIAIIVMVGWSIWFRRRKNRQLAEKQRFFEMQKEKELYENKVTFFTEVAHEIRTPLTLINGPLETIRELEVKDPKIEKNLQVISQNTKRLLNLVTQLLDFQKIGADRLVPNYEVVNVTDLLHETITRFEPTFLHNNKRLVVERIQENVMARIDREAVTKIISNLFNNALKYTKSEVVVTLETQENHTFVITVFSDNERIPNSQAEQIFEPFYQYDNKSKTRQGVGIGLTLSRSLALIHKGQLYLDLNRTDGNSFVLTIPINMDGQSQEHSPIQQTEWLLNEHVKPIQKQQKAHTILIVEDDKEILHFMRERLSDSYITECASNGKDAIEILRQGHIDLVVSDVMMPQMNGFELCEAIKGDINLCHIPFIFLTAKNDIDSKVKGLKIGAEAYIEKPFSYEYLKNQIASLLNNREREREAFSKHPFFPVKNMQMSKEDKEFMNKVIQVINDNISDETFNVERMAEILCMSRSSLLRKIKPLFNMPPLDFIHLVRLKKAAELIQEGRYTMGEISYMVGFSSHSYFSKLFCRQFGIMPKDFEKQVAEERLRNREQAGGVGMEELLK